MTPLQALRRSHPLTIRISKGELAKVTRAANRVGMAKSVWVRQLIRRGLLEEDMKLQKERERAQQQQVERSAATDATPAA